MDLPVAVYAKSSSCLTNKNTNKSTTRPDFYLKRNVSLKRRAHCLLSVFCCSTGLLNDAEKNEFKLQMVFLFDVCKLICRSIIDEELC